MEFRVLLKMSIGWFFVLGLVFFGGCDGGGADGGGGVEPVNTAPLVGTGGDGVESVQAGSKSKYFMKEDLGRHIFLVNWISKQNHVLTKEGSESESIKDERLEFLVRVSPEGTDEEGLLKLRMQVEQAVLELYKVKIESKSLVPPLQSETYPMLADIHRALQMLAGLDWEVWVDSSLAHKVTKVMGEDKRAEIAGESEVFKQYFDIYKGVFEKETAKGLVMSAGDYLPGKEVEVGQKWDMGIIPGSKEQGAFPIQTQCRLDELVREGDQEFGRVSFAIGFQSQQEEQRNVDGQPATVKKMLMDGSGELMFDLQQDFARDFLLKYKNTIDLLFADDSTGVITMDQEVTMRKVIVENK
ncbi:MAG: hypothetical protein GY869_17330 [Planctomycetes bacterium]|nr:hypothetical protein [Planctomycetota bacterium]